MKMTLQLAFVVVALAVVARAQLQQRPDPVPILKQISKQNDDGSYSFGYEAGDGSYKIETKYQDGSVQGKYGYVDDSGKLREVEYGASKNRGFEPSGSHINVPPPTIGKNENIAPLADGEEDDGQYREDPRIYESKEYRNNAPVQKAGSRRPVTQFRFQEAAQPAQPAYSTYEEPAQNSYTSFPSQSFYQTTQRPAYSGLQTFPRFQSFQTPTYQQPQQQQYYQQPQQPQYQQYQQPQYQSYSQPQFNYNGHPSVTNFDVGTGSYSVSYGR